MTTRADVEELLRHVTHRLLDRMRGLTDEEWRWTPVADPDLSVRWRLDHLTDVLVDGRNWTWLGLEPFGALGGPATSADLAVQRVTDARDQFLGTVLGRVDDADLARPVGDLAGPYGAATRLSYVLHVVDEVVHHAAEASLLRDLYAARSA